MTRFRRRGVDGSGWSSSPGFGGGRRARRRRGWRGAAARGGRRRVEEEVAEVTDVREPELRDGVRGGAEAPRNERAAGRVDGVFYFSGGQADGRSGRVGGRRASRRARAGRSASTTAERMFSRAEAQAPTVASVGMVMTSAARFVWSRLSTRGGTPRLTASNDWRPRVEHLAAEALVAEVAAAAGRRASSARAARGRPSTPVRLGRGLQPRSGRRRRAGVVAVRRRPARAARSEETSARAIPSAAPEPTVARSRGARASTPGRRRGRD